jgi:hypothetical protein
MREPLRQTVDDHAARLGVGPLSDEEMDRLLDLAKAAADSSVERRCAPRTCFLAGVAVGPGTGDRAERIAAVARTLD